MSLKIGSLWTIIRQNGGIWASLKALYIRDSLKIGTLVGTDNYGNRYYENNDYFLCRNRWVVYADHVGLNYDGSQVPAEWFGWLHHRTDLPPFKEPFRPKYPWMAAHEENMSGTRDQYVPYTTTRPKILPWKPPPGCVQSGKPSKTASVGKGGEIEEVCEDIAKKKQPPLECGDEDNRTPPKCEEEDRPPKCETKEVTKRCGERDENNDRPKCEKPVSAFH